jgi:hypothetical protein
MTFAATSKNGRESLSKVVPHQSAAVSDDLCSYLMGKVDYCRKMLVAVADEMK